MNKTNAMRILETEGIEFEAFEYDFEDCQAGQMALHSAEVSGIPPEQVFKTIVMRNEHREVFVFCVPANTTVNPKKARAITSSKEIDSVKPEELLGLTGYMRGGCSPLGMKKKYPTYIDETAILFDWICVSAGVRGMHLKVNGEKLAEVCGAELAELTL